MTSGTGTVTEVTHPLVRHKLGLLRDVTTTTQMFRQLVNELTLLLTYEATKDLADEEVEIETPLEQTTARRISGKKVAICPILRAGVGMLDGVLSLIPGARVGFIGLYRDEETLEAVEYFVKLPGDIADRDVILLDPMLATGNSTAAAVETVKAAGATSVRLIALIAVPADAQVIINEVDCDTPTLPVNDNLEFIEIYDGGLGNTSLVGYCLVFFNGSGDASYFAMDLTGSTDPAGYYLVGNASVLPTPAQTWPDNFLQNGADAVALYIGSAAMFPNGTAITLTGIVDAVVYDTSDLDDAGRGSRLLLRLRQRGTLAALSQRPCPSHVSHLGLGTLRDHQ